jgi:hypothetical protein
MVGPAERDLAGERETGGYSGESQAYCLRGVAHNGGHRWLDGA